MNTLKEYVKKYLVLMRPKTMMIYIFPLTLGFAAGMRYSNHVAWWRILCAYLSFLLGSFFSSTLNFYADVDSDKLHNDMYKDQPISHQPFVTGEMGKVETPLLFAIATLGCIGFGLLVGYQFAIFIFISIYFTLGILYSHPWFRFKDKPVLDVVTNAASAVMVLIAGWKLASPTTWPPVIPLVFGFIFSSTLYLPSVVNDIPFDEAAGFHTSGVVFGAKRCLNAMIPLCGLLTVAAVLTLIGPYGWQFKVFVAGALPGAIVFTWGMHLLYEPPHIRFNAGLLIYPLFLMLIFYLAYALQKALF